MTRTKPDSANARTLLDTRSRRRRSLNLALMFLMLAPWAIVLAAIVAELCGAVLGSSAWCRFM